MLLFTFAIILLRISMFMRDISLQLSFCVISLYAFHIRAKLVSQDKSGSIHSASFFWKKLQRIGINFFLICLLFALILLLLLIYVLNLCHLAVRISVPSPGFEPESHQLKFRILTDLLHFIMLFFLQLPKVEAQITDFWSSFFPNEYTGCYKFPSTHCFCCIP